ncbi:hypothetical protein [Actinacidiphila sp. ITFR-21]|uniref:hypothetical protein n=1 Tax=Actinacidiphila sp. ITFR-21 TaxID=3075199 RepID=UPI00288AED01|nr:hypothetical protein [Streptomyces sp. ITFR-21]WNI15495.1 hypothetical protein RLT57_08120 [Streptomyces sp. ITFR-21]
MSHNQPPPNPYEPPPAEGGYGSPQPPQGEPRPGYGSPQEPPAQPVHGEVPPQPAYGQPAHGYGQPSVPPRAGRGRRTGVVVAAAVVALVVAGAAVVLVNRGGGSSGDGKRYKLATPATVATDYKKSSDPSASQDGFDDDDVALLKKLGMADPQPVSAGYVEGSETTGRLLSFSGAWGSVKDPKKVADGMMAEMRSQAAKDNGVESDGTTTELIGGVQTLHPAGADDAVVECQSAKITDGQSKQAITLPICLWADRSTVGTITPIDLSFFTAGGGATSAQSTADLLAKVRTDTRVEVG